MWFYVFYFGCESCGNFCREIKAQFLCMVQLNETQLFLTKRQTQILKIFQHNSDLPSSLWKYNKLSNGIQKKLNFNFQFLWTFPEHVFDKINKFSGNWNMFLFFPFSPLVVAFERVLTEFLIGDIWGFLGRNYEMRVLWLPANYRKFIPL